MSFPIMVDYQPGHGGEAVPDALHFGPASVAVARLPRPQAGVG